MGKPTGFLEYKREDNKDIDPQKRIENYEWFHEPLKEEERREQGARCMNCGVPLCQSGMKLSGMYTGCPLHNLIPEWNDEVYHSHPAYAFSRLQKTNNFPEFTGRVCPALCEKACVEGENDDPVTIRDNELYVIETAFEKGYIKPRIPENRSSKKVAVIGAGPAGLACADRLNRRGHNVTVYEREPQIGGLLMYGIPNMKLPKEVIIRRKKLMEEEGVVFKTGVNVGVDITADELKKQYDAIVLCCGAKKPRSLPAADPAKIGGVYYAVDYLSQATRDLLSGAVTGGRSEALEFSKKKKKTSAKEEEKQLSPDGAKMFAAGKNVIIVGGGDTGNDCTATSIRQGAKSVIQLEMMPCPPSERAESNPWPEWPKTLKTDYGQEEAIALFGHDPRIYETTVKSVETKKDGLIKSVTTVKVRFENRKMVEVEGSEKTYPCDMLLIAAGFVGCEDYTAEAFNIKRTQRNVAETAEGKYATSVPGVFAAGDMRRGQSLVVWGIVEGRSAAREVDEYLMGYSGLA